MAATPALRWQFPRPSEESVVKTLRRRLATETAKRKEAEAELKKKEAEASVNEKWAIHNEEWAMMERAERKEAVKLSHDLIDARKGQNQKRKAELEAEMKQDEENEAFAKRLRSIEFPNKK
jgi:hypothetical protein